MLKKIFLKDFGSQSNDTNLTLATEQAALMKMSYPIENTIHFFIHYIEIKESKPERIDNTSINNQVIEKLFQELKENILKEYEEKSTQVIEINLLMEESYLFMKSLDWQLAKSNLIKILRLVQPFNINEAIRLIQVNNPSTLLLQAKPVILLLGETGSGKSTTLHFLAGSQMSLTNVDGIEHIAPVKIKNPALKNVTTSPYAHSDTHQFNAILVNFGCFNQKVVLCDTPGFEDTGTSEIDLANSIGLNKIILACEDIKPVIFISQHSVGDKFQGIKRLINILIKLIPSIGDHISTFSYLFTKYPLKDNKGRDYVFQLHFKLVNFRESLLPEEIADQNFLYIINDIINKTANGSCAYAKIINPLTDCSEDILDELSNTLSIKYPSEVFNFTVSKKVITAVNNQIKRIKQSIECAIYRADITHICCRLDELNLIYQTIPQEFIKKVYENLINSIIEHFSIQINNKAVNLKNYIACDDEADEEKLKFYINELLIVKQYSMLFNNYFKKNLIPSEVYIKNIITLCQQKLETTINAVDLNLSIIKIQLNRIKILECYFPELSLTYNNKCQLLNSWYLNILNTVQQYISNNEIALTFLNTSKLLTAINTLPPHLNKEWMEEQFIGLKKYCKNYVANKVDQLILLIERKNLINEDILKLSEWLLILNHNQKSNELCFLLNEETIDICYNKLISSLKNRLLELDNNISKLLEQEETFNLIESPFNQLTLLLKIPDTQVQANTSIIYSNIIENLISNTKEKVQVIKSLLNLNHIEVLNCKILYKKILSLKESEWLDQYFPELYSQNMQLIEKELILHIQEIYNRVCSTKFSLYNLTKFEKINNAINTLQSIDLLKSIYPTITDIIQSTLKIYLEKIESEFNRANETLEKGKHYYIEQDFSHSLQLIQIMPFLKDMRIETLLACLEILKKNTVLKDQIRNLLDHLMEFLQSYILFIDTKLKKIINIILSYKINETKQSVIFDNAIKFANQLDELNNLKVYYPRLYIYLIKSQDIFATWHTRLLKELSNFSDQLSQINLLSDNYRLLEQLTVLRALGYCDTFLNSEKFMHLYRDYQTIYLKNIEAAEVQILSAIEKSDYTLISYEIEKLKNVSNEETAKIILKKINSNLCRHIDNLIEDTQTKMIILELDLNINQLNSIMVNLKKLNQARIKIQHHLENYNRIDYYIVTVKDRIWKCMGNFFSTINASITNYNFLEAENKLAISENYCLLLGEYCYNEARSKVKELRQEINIATECLVTQYNALSINEYYKISPSLICDKLKQISEKYTFYESTLNRIKEVISNKFQKELQLIKINQNYEQIRSFERAIKYLPLDLQAIFEHEMQEYKGITQKNSNVNQTGEDYNLIQTINDNNYLSVANNYEYLLIKNTCKKTKKALKALDDDEYSTVKDELLLLSQQPDSSDQCAFFQIKAIVSTFLNDKINKTNKIFKSIIKYLFMKENVNRDDFKSLLFKFETNLLNLIKFKNILYGHMTELTTSELNAFFKEIEEYFSKNIKDISNNIMSTIKENSFSEAYMKLNCLIIASNLFDRNRSSFIFTHIENNRLILNESLNLMIEKYCFLDLTDYKQEPPKSILNEIKFIIIFNDYYNEMYHKLSNIILEKFRHQLTLFRKSKNEVIEEVIESITFNLNFVSSDLQDILNQEIKNEKDKKFLSLSTGQSIFFHKKNIKSSNKHTGNYHINNTVDMGEGERDTLINVSNCVLALNAAQKVKGLLKNMWSNQNFSAGSKLGFKVAFAAVILYEGMKLLNHVTEEIDIQQYISGIR